MSKRMSVALPEHCSVVFSKAEIETALDQLAQQLNEHFSGSSVIVLCVMNGGLIFSGHLLTRLTFECHLDYCHATRYNNTTRGQDLHWLSEPNMPLAGANVLILDDILDEGNTLKAIMAYCTEQDVKQAVSAVLLDKRHDRRVAGISADFTALEVDDRYVFGFGMDYEGMYRNLDAVYAVDQDS